MYYTDSKTNAQALVHMLIRKGQTGAGFVELGEPMTFAGSVFHYIVYETKKERATLQIDKTIETEPGAGTDEPKKAKNAKKGKA